MKEFNVYCLGAGQTGKTALAVRYLTGRYIHEYTSLEEEVYTRVVKHDGERVNVNILIKDSRKIQNDIEMDSKSGIMVVYSVTDKDSFAEAHSLLRHLKALRISAVIPVVLVATKVDLVDQRRIPEEESSTLAGKMNCTPFEVSAARNDNVGQLFQQMFKQIDIRHQLSAADDDEESGPVFRANRTSVHSPRESLNSTLGSESDVSTET